MTYVDGFVIPIAKKRLAEYGRVARKAMRIWMDHGALEYRECVADQLEMPDLQGKMTKPFPKSLRLKPGETVIFAYIVYRSRAHRDKVNAAVMTDKRAVKMMTEDAMPFDPKRMNYGGFKSIVAAHA